MGVERTDKTARDEAIPAAAPPANHWQHREPLAIDAVQYKAWCDDKLSSMTADAQSTAQAGVADAPTALPHGDAIQRSFGAHDVGGVQAHVGGAAADAASAMGAQAYATGGHVAFAAAPDLHLAAHEAAHVVQQRGGVQLKGGVGEAGDPHERHADAVADAVVAGRSAEPLLDQYRGASASPGVQRKDKPISEGWTGQDTWNNGRTRVDKEGHAERSAPGDAAHDKHRVVGAQMLDENVGSDAVTRVVLDNLKHAKSKKAVVVVPSEAVLKANTSLDVLLHFHGGSGGGLPTANGQERDNTAKVDGQQSLDQEATHDLHRGKVPQQIAASGGNILAITLELADDDHTDAGDGLVDEVFEYLRTQSLLQKTHTRGRTILSGYSHGAVNAIDEAAEHEPGKGVAQETTQGLFLFDPVSETKGSTLKLINRRLEDDLGHLTKLAKPADQLSYLRTDGYLVRIFGQSPVFNADTKEYQGAIDGWFNGKHASPLPTDTAVMTQWQSNYQAVAVPRLKGRTGWNTHATMEGAGQDSSIWERHYVPGSGNLEKALGAWHDQHKKTP